MRRFFLWSILASFTLPVVVWGQKNLIPNDTADIKVRIISGSEVQHPVFDKTFTVDKEGRWMVQLAGPNGIYEVAWSKKIPASAAYELSAELFKANGNQTSAFSVSMDQGLTWRGVSSDKDWTWQTQQTSIFDPVAYVDAQGKKLDDPKDQVEVLFMWRFTKPHNENIWQTGLGEVSLTPISADRALKEYQKPLAQGLPDVALPPRQGIEKHPNWQKKDGMLLRDGKPFFPIGYVMFNTDDRHLGQARAVGANATHIDEGWSNVMREKGKADPEALDRINKRLDLLGRYDLVTFPLLAGHYVPKWFLRDHPQEKAWPLGSNGGRTGSWFVYSIHYPPFKEAITDFWRAISPVYARSPAVLAANTWNEPSYGGIFSTPSQYADYTSWSIANFHAWLTKKYQTIDTLNQRWQTKYASWDKITPPKSPSQMSRVAWIDWMRFGQETFAGFFDWERDVIHKTAPDLKLVHKKQTNIVDNSARASGTNFHLMGRSEDFFGINVYGGSCYGYRNTLDVSRSYAGDKPVFIFETNVMPSNAQARTPERVRTQLWSLIVGGARGIFLFCMDADPSHGLLSDQSVLPGVRPEYVRFTQTVNKFGEILALPNEPADIAVLYSTTAALHLHNSPQWPGPFNDAYSLVRNSHYNVDVLPEEQCDASTLQKYKAVVLPSYAILPQAAMDALETYTQNGGKILAFSHTLERDENLTRLNTLPACLGLKTRNKPIGDRIDQKILLNDPALLKYGSEEFDTTGNEQVLAIKESAAPLIQGQALTVEKTERVLAYNNDSYPAAITTKNGGVVYLAFESRYSEPLRRMVEGSLREIFGVRQTIRLVTDSGSTYAAVITRIIRDPRNGKTYLLVLNTAGEEKQLTVETAEPFKEELFQSGTKSLREGKITIKPYEVYLLRR
jgi:beta-galactosidase